MLNCLRAIPNLLVIRPADGNEVAGAYEQALLHPHTPSVLSLTRQAAPAVEGTSREKVALGAYVIADYKTSDDANLSLIIVATGSEVHVSVLTGKILLVEGVSVRIVSMPCWELFEQQTLEYQLQVLYIL